MECSAEGQTVRVHAGEFAELRLDEELTVEPFDEQDTPAFVRAEQGGEVIMLVSDWGPGGFTSTETPDADGYYYLVKE